MTNRLKTIGNSAFTIIAMLIISCSMCATAWSLKQYSEWTNIAIAATLIGGIALFAWLIWVAYIICKKRDVAEMPPKSRILIGMVSGVLFLYWIFLVTSPIVALIWFPFFAWSEYMSIKSLKDSK